MKNSDCMDQRGSCLIMLMIVFSASIAVLGLLSREIAWNLKETRLDTQSHHIQNSLRKELYLAFESLHEDPQAAQSSQIHPMGSSMYSIQKTDRESRLSKRLYFLADTERQVPRWIDLSRTLPEGCSTFVGNNAPRLFSSGRNCTKLLTTSIRRSIIVRGNLTVQSPMEISAGPGEILRVVIRGSVNLPRGLLLSSEANSVIEVISLGSMYVNSLEIKGMHEASILLYSHRGGIEIPHAKSEHLCVPDGDRTLELDAPKIVFAGTEHPRTDTICGRGRGQAAWSKSHVIGFSELSAQDGQ